MTSNSKIAIDLAPYKNLMELKVRDQTKLVEHLKDTLNRLDKEVVYGTHKNEHMKEVFGMKYDDVQKLFDKVFFDYKAIIEVHHDKNEQKLMEILGEENHPLAVFLGKTDAYSATGEKLSKDKFTSADDVTDFFQEFLYALRYCSMKDLADFLMLGDYDLLNALKTKNVKNLLEIQPALEWQKYNNITVGKRIKGTGYFDVGNIEVKDSICPVCKREDTMYTVDNLILCRNCRAGIEKQD